MKNIFQSLHKPWVQLALILGVYTIFLVPTLARQGISWDEQNDLWVAQAYLAQPGGWLVGSEIDPSQTRLPMFAVALVYRLLGTTDLITGRAVSYLVGLLTLVGVYVFCRERFDHRRGLLAVGLLATSPFFLSFARVAFTETDIYLACAFAWLMVCVGRLQDRPTIGRGALVGVVLGLALSAKFTSLAVFPAVWLAVYQVRKRIRATDIPQPEGIVLPFLTNWILLTILVGMGYGIAAAQEAYAGPARLIHYSLVLLAWALPLAWAAWKCKGTAPAGALGGFITALALLTFLVIPPDHLTNPEILGGLEWRLFHEMSHPAAFILEAGALHILSLIFKSGPLIGLGMLVSVLAMAWEWKQPGIRFPLVACLCYFLGLIILPLAQTFYIVPLLPALAVFTADRYFHLFGRQRLLALTLGGLAVVSLGVDLALCYPDYNLNGYQWLGRRVIAGRASIGYRSIVQTPSDGVQQAFEWLNENAKPRERVLAYVLPWHIVQATAPKPAYRIRNGFEWRIYANTDYVVLHINAQVRQSWWTDVSKGDVFQPLYDAAWLEAHYEKVFAVKRRFGIEMASVWRKK